MTGELITLPVRIGLRGTRLALRVAEGATDRAIATTFRLAGLVLAARQRRPSSAPAPGSVTPSRASEPRRSPSRTPEPAGRTSEPPGRTSEPPGRTSEPPRSDAPSVRATPPHGNGAGELASERLQREGMTTTLPPAGVDTSPEHVSEEPELVVESAQPGAEEGAGASVTVREPWEGYGGLNARTVISQLSQATAAELAAVELYERAHRGRRTVLESVARELQSR